MEEIPKTKEEVLQRLNELKSNVEGLEKLADSMNRKQRRAFQKKNRLALRKALKKRVKAK